MEIATKSLIRNKHTTPLYNTIQPVIRRQEYEPSEEVKDEEKITKSVVSKIQEIAGRNDGRLFAVIHILGKQFKVTTEDLIVVEGNWPPTIGDQLRIEKVLLIGGSDFTVVGRPILSLEQARVDATVVEKTLTYAKVHFMKKRRKQYMRLNFWRFPQTVLRINNIQLNTVEETNDCQGNDGKIF